MEGIPLSIWYDWRDDGTDPKEPEHHFGTVRHSLQETKPSYSALQTLVAELRGYRFEKRVEASDFILMFRKGSLVKYAAWTTNTAPHEATVAGRRLTLTDVPQYISPQ
jgi:hypothetical protein